MDFDSVITLLFIIGFFVLPSILKQVKARQKKKADTASPKVPEKRTGLFGRLSDFVDRIAKEIEAQKQQQQGVKKEESSDIWQILAQDEEWVPGQETIEPSPAPKVREKVRKRVHATDPVTDPMTDPMADPMTAPGMETEIPAARQRRERPGKILTPSFPRPYRRRRFSGDCRFRPNELQNAVVWSEILSKPVALRD